MAFPFPAFCIAPSETPWRRPLAEERFRAAGLDVEFFDGIHGSTMGIRAGLPCCDHPGEIMPAGHVGINLSMFLLLTVALERKYEAVLILENDALPREGFLEEFSQSLASLPDDWEIVHVGHCHAEDKPTERIDDRVARVRYPLCTHAMLYRQSVIPLILRSLRLAGGSNHFDILLQRMVLPRARHYAFLPPLVDQAPPEAEARLGTTGALSWRDIPGWFDWETIYDEQVDHRQHRGGVIVEVGSWLGRSTAYLAERVKWRMAPIEIHVVDTWRGSANEPAMRETVERCGGDLYPEWERNMSRCGVLPLVIPHRMDSVEAARLFADGSVDCVFIDADHSYESVRADILAWLPKIRPAYEGHHGGTLAGHDYDREGVRRAVRETLGGRFRVWKTCWIVDGGR